MNLAKNDITGDTLVSKKNTDKFRDNYDRIFGKPVFEKKKCESCGQGVLIHDGRTSENKDELDKIWCSEECYRK